MSTHNLLTEDAIQPDIGPEIEESKEKILPIIRLEKFQRQEIYQFLSTKTLYCKISKLSKKERDFVRDIKHANGQRTLVVIPPG